jgi:hypothetical protein
MVGMRPNISRKALWQVKFVHCQFNLGLRCPMRFKISDLMLGSSSLRGGEILLLYILT